MSKKLFADLPEFVRITIYSQVRYLLATPYFKYEQDTDDIIQDLILYYLEKFHNKRNFDEPYIVASLQHEAHKLLRTRMRKRFGLSLSLEDLLDEHEMFIIDGGFENTELQLFISLLSKNLSEQEKCILQHILDGYSLDKIAKEMHLSKATIYKFFEKMKKNFKS